MTTLRAVLTHQGNQQLEASINALLKQLAPSMTRTVDSLINQLIPYKTIAGSKLATAAKAGVLEAVVLSNSPLIQPKSSTGNQPNQQQFTITIKANQQILELTSQTPIAKGAHLQINITPNNQVVILNVSDPLQETAAPKRLANEPAINANIRLKTTTEQSLQTSAKSNATVSNDISSQQQQTQPALKNKPTIEQGLRQALPVQEPIKNLLPLLREITAQPPKNWPKPLLNNLAVLLKQFPNARQAQQPESLKQAINNSGTFFEAKLAQLAIKALANKATGASNLEAKPPSSAPLNYDIKGLIQRLLPQIDKAVAVSDAAPKSNITGSYQSNSLLSSALSTSTKSDDGKPFGQTYSPQPLPDLLLTTNTPQANAKTSNNKNVDILLRQLGSQLIASLARSQLNQLETLANRASNSADGQAPANSWSLEIPIMQGNNIDNLVIRIDQNIAEDGSNSLEKDDRKQWTVMLAFDLHQLGKMNVQLKVVDHSVSAIVWSEQQHTHREVQAQVKSLKANLERVGVDVKHIECQLGVPTEKNQPLYTQLVDVRT